MCKTCWQDIRHVLFTRHVGKTFTDIYLQTCWQDMLPRHKRITSPHKTCWQDMLTRHWTRFVHQTCWQDSKQQKLKYMLAKHVGKTYKENLVFKKYNVSQDTCTRHVYKTCRKYMSTRHQPYLADMSCGFLVSCQRLLRSWCLVNIFGVLSTPWDYRWQTMIVVDTCVVCAWVTGRCIGWFKNRNFW